jgi:hypothetical protein
MSYEGRVQVLCKNGHYREFDCYEWEYLIDGFKCPFCQESAAWTNSVDDTNGDMVGYVELKVKRAAHTCTCPRCSNTHRIAPEEYEIPHG